MGEKTFPQSYRKAFQDLTGGTNNQESALVIPASQFTQLDNALINERNILEKAKGYSLDGSPFPNTTDSFIRMLVNYKRGTTVDTLVAAASDAGNTNTTYKVDLKQTSGDGVYSYIGYTTGTATFTNGSPNVTGSGTAWNLHLKAGDKIKPNAYSNWYEIQSVGGATALTLTANYTDTTASGAAYMARIILHKDFIPVAIPFNNNLIITNGSETMMSFNNTTVLLIQDADAPKASVLEPHKSRVFAAKTTGAPSSIYWSAVNDETVWDATSVEPVYPQDNGNICAIKSFADSLIVFKDNGKIYQVVGEFDQSAAGAVTFIRKLDTPENIGVIAAYSPVVHVDNKLYFLCETGVYSIDSRMFIRKESWDINPTVTDLVLKSTLTSTKSYSFTTKTQWDAGTYDGLYATAGGQLRNFADLYRITDCKSDTAYSTFLDTANVLHVVYTTGTGNKTLKYARYATDGTVTTSTVATEATDAINYAYVAVDGTTTVGVLYGKTNNIKFTDSSDNGATWSAIQTLYSGAEGKTPVFRYDASHNIQGLFSDGGVVKFIKRVSGTWTVATALTFGAAAYIKALKFNGSEYRCLLYITGGTLYCGYSHDSGATWNVFTSISTVDNASGLYIDAGTGKSYSLYRSTGSSTVKKRNWDDATDATFTTQDTTTILGGFNTYGGNDIALLVYGSISPYTEKFFAGANTITAADGGAGLTTGYQGAFQNNGAVFSSAVRGQNTDELLVRRCTFIGTWTSPVESDATLTAWGTYQVNNPITSGNTVGYGVALSTTSSLPAQTAITNGAIISTDSTKDFIQTTITVTLLGLENLSTFDGLVLNYTGTGVDAKLPVGYSFNNELYLSCARTGQSANNVILFYDRANKWGDRTFGMTFFARYKSKLYAGSATAGKVYILNQGYNAEGSAYTLTAISKEDLLGALELDKDIKKVYIIYEVKSTGSFTFSYRLDNFISLSGSTWKDTSVDQTQDGLAEVLVGNKAKSIQFKVTSSSADVQLGIIGWIVLYDYLGIR
jgi:hypothetical protein